MGFCIKMQQSDKSNYLSRKILVLAITVYLAVIFLPAFLNKGPLLQTDQPMWTAVSHLWNKEVVPSQKWFCETITDRAGAGQVMGKTYSLSLMLPWILTNIFDSATAIKVSMFLSALLFVLAFFFLACRYMPNIYALLCSLVVLTPMFYFIVSGMWYNIFSLGCALIFWSSCERFYNNGNTSSIVIAIIFLSLSIYSHPVGIILCVAIWTSYIILYLLPQSFNSQKKQKFPYLFLVVPIISMLLSSPQILSVIGYGSGNVLMVEHSLPQKLYVNYPMETVKELFYIILPKENALLSNISVINRTITMALVIMLSMIGIYSLYIKKKLNKLIPIIFLILFTFIFTSRIYNLFHLNISIFKSLSPFSDRFRLIAQVYLILMSGVGLYYLAEFSAKIARNKTLYKFTIMILIFCFGLIALITPKTIFIDEIKCFETFEKSLVYQDTIDLFEWLKKNVKIQNERVYFEDTYKTVQWNSNNYQGYQSHIFALASIYTNISQVNGWTGFTNEFAKEYECGGGNCLFGIALEDGNISDEFIYDKMKLLNCKYIVANSEKAIRRLKSVSFLKLSVNFGNFFVFENMKIVPAWAYKAKTGEKVTLSKYSSTCFELFVEGEKGELIQISMASHPNWKAVYGNSEIPILNYRALMQIYLPTDGKQIIHFKYILKRKFSFLLLNVGIFCLLFVIFLSPKLQRPMQRAR